MKRKFKFILGASALIFAAAFFGAHYVSNGLCVSDYIIPEQPLKILRTAAFPDGGSMKIDLIDAADKHWEISRIGSLDVNPAKQKMEIVRWFGFVPIRCEVPFGSALERKIKQFLAQWLLGRLTEEEKGLLAQGDVKTFKAVSWDVVNIWAFVNWIDLRR
jgi:hypothetical protein